MHLEISVCPIAVLSTVVAGFMNGVLFSILEVALDVFMLLV
jgi:hypothetical protein